MDASSRDGASGSADGKADDWAKPGGWRGRADFAAAGERGKASLFTDFGPPAHSSRKLDALDLATPRPSPKDSAAQSKGERLNQALDLATPHTAPAPKAPGGMPTPQLVRAALMANTGKPLLDARGLAGALGKDHKFAARIEAKIMENTSMQRAFTHQMMNQVEHKGWGALHAASQDAAKNLVNKKLSDFTAKKK